jgi:pilus assembly protein CpaB
MRLPRPKISPIALLFIVAIVLGLGVAWLVMHTLQQREAQAEAALQAKAHAGEVSVVVPTRNLTPGEVADSSTMAERSVPRDLLPPDAVTAGDWPQYDGHPLSHAVFRGIPVRSSDFGAFVHHSAFLSLLQPGQRAITTDVSTDNSLAGLLQPGNKIDLLLLSHRGNTVEEIPILRQVTVLATGANFGQAPAASAPGDGGNTFGNITLALNPRQTAILALAEQAGTLRVALEPAQPPAGGPLPALPESALFGGSGNRASAAHRGPTVQYIIGSPGQNQTLTLPLATPATQAAAATPPPTSVPAAVKAMTASTQQALSNLQALLRQSPLPSQPTAEKP